MRTGADTRRLRFGRDTMGAGLVCLTHMRSWLSPVLSMGERKDSVLSLIFHPFPPGRCIHPLAAPTSPNTHPGTGDCLWRDVPQDTQLLTRVHTAAAAVPGRGGAHTDVAAKNGFPGCDG